MTEQETREKIFEIISKGILHGEDNYGMPTDKTIENIADALIEAGLRFGESLTATFNMAQLDRINELERRLAEAKRRTEGEAFLEEWFAKEHGFTPDCSPYYIALQYERRIKVLERALEIAAHDSFDYAPEGAIEQAEKELAGAENESLKKNQKGGDNK